MTSVPIGVVTVSDRASRGEYQDKGGPGAEDWLRATITSPMEITRRIIPDGRESVATTLRGLCDEGCDLILMASHGRRGIKGFLLGSETNKVLTHATIPVLVLR